jgi:hypothetical protein
MDPLKFLLYCSTNSSPPASGVLESPSNRIPKKKTHWRNNWIQRIMDERGPDYVRHATSLTWEEFLELYWIVKPSTEQKGCGRWRTLARIDRFFILTFYLMSNCDRHQELVHPPTPRPAGHQRTDWRIEHRPDR